MKTFVLLDHSVSVNQSRRSSFVIKFPVVTTFLIIFMHLHVGRLGDNQEVKDSSLGDSKCLTVKRQLPTVW